MIRPLLAAAFVFGFALGAKADEAPPCMHLREVVAWFEVKAKPRGEKVAIYEGSEAGRLLAYVNSLPPISDVHGEKVVARFQNGGAVDLAAIKDGCLVVFPLGLPPGMWTGAWAYVHQNDS